ncbi:MAG: hypothetical protein SH859_13065 [Hyphomicrobium aestuarii]|nr:hypothetical protein [Hyphomicrobium aestuarii]
MTADEAALAERLSPVLARGVRRAPVPEPSKPHVSLAAEPEEAVVAPPIGSDAEDLLPPPLPDADAWNEGTWNEGTWNEVDGNDLSARDNVPLSPTTLLSPTLLSTVAARSVAAPPPWLSKRWRRSWQARAATGLAWSVTLLVIASLVAVAAIGLVGVERVAGLFAELAVIADETVGRIQSIWLRVQAN